MVGIRVIWVAMTLMWFHFNVHINGSKPTSQACHGPQSWGPCSGRWGILPHAWLVTVSLLLMLTGHTPAILSHWGRVKYICVSEIIIIGSDYGLSPGRHQAIFWTNVGILLIGPLGINLSEILIEINTFSFNKMHLKMSSAKWRLFRLGLNVLNPRHVLSEIIGLIYQQISYLKHFSQNLWNYMSQTCVWKFHGKYQTVTELHVHQVNVFNSLRPSDAYMRQ